MLLTAIASLASIAEGGLSSLVDKADAKDCLEIIFDKKNYSFIGCEISSNNGEERYLYHRDKSGKPGLFTSWTIDLSQIQKFQKLLKKKERTEDENEDLSKFWKDKFEWFSSPAGDSYSTKRKRKHKIFNQKFLSKLADERARSLISGLCISYANSLDRIHAEVTRKLENYVVDRRSANKLLVTIAFKGDNGIEYPGDIEPLVELFESVVSGRSNPEGNLVCSICNSRHGKAISIPPPLEFITQDQLVYVPGGIPRNKGKAIALCQSCSDKLRKGQELINNYLSFEIPNSKLFFWLIPVIPDVEDLRNYITDLKDVKKEPLYLRNLKNMCRELELIEGLSNSSNANGENTDSDTAESFLTFTSAFCYKDDKGHTRISAVAEGIYPSRLKELVDASLKVQKRYPYFLLDKVLGTKIRFNFPLFLSIFKGENAETDAAQAMASLFTGTQMDGPELISILADIIRSRGLTRYSKDDAQRNQQKRMQQKMKEFVTWSLKTFIVLEYIIEASLIEIDKGGATPMIENNFNDKYIDELQKFIKSHELLNKSETVRSIFLSGVAVGLLLEIQYELFESYPFWKHLNRLELDIPRIMSFFPQVKAKLMQYSTSKMANMIEILRPTIEYIGANLDFKSEKLESTDLIDLVFAIGLSEGYLIFRRANMNQSNKNL